MGLIWLGVLGYVVLQLAIGVWASRGIKKEEDYLLAGRRLGLTLVTFSLFATWFGAETVMGSSAAIAEEGLSGGRADPFGYALCFVALAVFLAYQLRARGYVTVGDFFRDRYDRTVEVVAVCVLIPTSIIWAAAQLLAFGQVLAVVTDSNIETTLVIATLLVMSYTVLGGLMGDVVTDLVQGIVLIIGLVILLVLVFNAAGGIGPAIASIEPEQLRLFDPEDSFLGAIDVWAIPIIGSLVAQEAISRTLAAKTPEIARKGAYGAAGLYLLVGLVPVLIALVGSHIAPDLEHRDEFVPELARSLMPPVLFIVFSGAIISAILSTVDSALLSVSSFVTHNLIDPMRPNASDRDRVRTARIAVIGSGLVAYLIARSSDTIYGLVEAASSFGTAGIAVSVLIGLSFRIGGPMAALASIGAGIVATILGDYVIVWEGSFVIALAVALVTYLGVARLEGRLARRAA